MPSLARITASIICLAAIAAAVIPWYADHLKTESLEKAGMGWKAEALHSAERSVSLNPLAIDNLFVLAGAQQRLGRTEEARETLTRAADMQPLNYAVWEQLAVYERDKWNEPDTAREHFEKAVSLNPQDKQLRARAGLTEEKPD